MCRSHLQDFTYELITKHGPRTTGMIWHAFTNIGNFVPGSSPDEQMDAVHADLLGDDRLEVVQDNPGRGGDWFGIVVVED